LVLEPLQRQFCWFSHCFIHSMFPVLMNSTYCDAVAAASVVVIVVAVVVVVDAVVGSHGPTHCKYGGFDETVAFFQHRLS
ncbi:hypothetical protein Tco_0855550, partial [Tanacetum coccineum]